MPSSGSPWPQCDHVRAGVQGRASEEIQRRCVSPRLRAGRECSGDTGSSPCAQRLRCSCLQRFLDQSRRGLQGRLLDLFGDDSN